MAETSRRSGLQSREATVDASCISVPGLRRGDGADTGERKPAVGTHVLFKDGRISRRGVVRFAGVTSFAEGWWLGVELPEATGKNDGSIQGVNYFHCKPQHGLFIRLGKVVACAESAGALSDPEASYRLKDSVVASDIFVQGHSPWEDLDRDQSESPSNSRSGSTILNRRNVDHLQQAASSSPPSPETRVRFSDNVIARSSRSTSTDMVTQFSSMLHLQHLEERLSTKLDTLQEAVSNGTLASKGDLAKMESRIMDRLGAVENSLLALGSKLTEALANNSEASVLATSDDEPHETFRPGANRMGMSIVLRNTSLDSQGSTVLSLPGGAASQAHRSFAVRRRKQQYPTTVPMPVAVPPMPVTVPPMPASVKMRASVLGGGDHAFALLQKNHETRRASHVRIIRANDLDTAVQAARKSLMNIGDVNKLPRVSFTIPDLAGRTDLPSPAAAVPRLVPPATVVEEGADDPSLGHEFRGVSVACMNGALMNEVLEAGHERSSAVYEIEPEVILTKGKDLTCPRDGRPGTAYVDALRGADNAGYATHMLSYTWGYAIGDIVDALTSFCQQRGCEQSRTYFWVCCLCINQHRVREERQKGSTVPFEEFREAFGKRVGGIGHMVALMTPWNNPMYLKRVWCDFEIFTAVNLGEETCQVSITMPPREVEAMRRTLVNGGSTAEMWKAFTNVKIQEANASVQEDKERILALIEESCGFHFLDSQVAKCLQSWIVTSCESYLEAQLEARSLPDEELAQLCSGVARIIGEVGMTTEAERMLQEGYDIFKQADKLGTEKGAVMIMNLGTIKGVNGDHEGQKKYLEEAMHLHKELGSLQSQDGAQLLLNLGACCAMLKDIKGATKYYEVAMTVLENLGTLETTQGATVLMNLACAKGEQGYKESEIKYLEKAKAIREKTGTLETPDGAYLLTCEGIAHAEIDFEEALPFFEQAKKIYEKTGMMDSSDAIELLEKIQDVKDAIEEKEGS